MDNPREHHDDFKEFVFLGSEKDYGLKVSKKYRCMFEYKPYQYTRLSVMDGEDLLVIHYPSPKKLRQEWQKSVEQRKLAGA